MKYLLLIIFLIPHIVIPVIPVKFHDLTNEEQKNIACDLLDHDPSPHSIERSSIELCQDRQLTKKLIEYQDTIIGIIIYQRQKNKSKIIRLAFNKELIKRERCHILTRERCHILTKVLTQSRCYNRNNRSVTGNLESVHYWKKKFLQ